MKFISMTLLLLVITSNVFSQEKNNFENLLKSPDGFVYTNNKPGAYFTIDFKGDSLKNAGFQSAFNIDGSIFQVIVNNYERSAYTNRQDSSKEIALLKGKMSEELDYVSKEMLKKELVSGFEVFKNKDGKNYFLWHYLYPATEVLNKGDILSKAQYFLTFVANQHVVGITTPVFENEKIEERISGLKQLADRIDVFGSTIDVDGLYYKLDAMAAGKQLEYVDSANGYILTVPEWFNITVSPEKDVYIGTVPDINNIQNAILIRTEKKTKGRTFKEFNESKLPSNLKTGDKFGSGTFMLKKEISIPEAANDGLSYKITVAQGSSLYLNHYVTIETSNSYLLVLFTATPETFELNHPRFLEFVKNIQVIK